jgi:TonB family protein
MKKILFYIWPIISFLAVSCEKDNENPTGINQNNVEPAPCYLGDTSGYATRPTGWIVMREAPMLTKIVNAQNPEYAKINKISGRVFIHYCITTVGTVRGVVVDSTDNEIFNRPTLEAVIQWEFTPAIGVDSLPMELWQFAPFSFHND